MAESQRKKFRTFDGLRGVAALMVFLFHLTPIWPQLPFPDSAYLSVDMFFMLSGFVIGHAYHDRLAGGLGFVRFVCIRLIRLYPLYILACLLGLATPVTVALLTDQWWLARPAVMALPWAAFMLPSPDPDPAARFLLNPPAWSLFFEMAICIAYAASFRWLTKRTLIGIVLVSAVLLATGSIYTGSVNLSPPGMLGLCSWARPVFSSAMGVLLHRLYREGSLPVVRVRAEMAILVFLCLTLVPASGAWSGAASALAVIIGFPIVMIVAIAHQPTARTADAMAVAGDLSYPLYALHWPVIMAVAAAGNAIGLDAVPTHVMAVPLVIAAAWIVARYYDPPVRRWATRHLDLLENPFTPGRKRSARRLQGF